MKIFAPGDPTRVHDEVPGEGTYYYRIRAMRVVGAAGDPVAPAERHRRGAGVSRRHRAIGGHARRRPGTQMLGIDFVKTLTDPLAEIYRGVHVQASDATHPCAINVTLAARSRDRRPTSPSIAHARVGVPERARPRHRSSASVRTGPTSLRHTTSRRPARRACAIDSRGLLYTDNAASDATVRRAHLQLRSRDRRARTHVGSTNYYSLLLQNAHPVSVQSLLVAPSPRGEALYIADATAQRITLMTLPWRCAGQRRRRAQHLAALHHEPAVQLQWLDDDGHAVRRHAGRSRSTTTC